jgi:multiple sugar transport system permease protein
MLNKLKSDRIISWLFLIPAVIVITITALIPLLYSILLSFQSVKLNIPDTKTIFVGFDNYIRIFEDTLFKTSTINTILFAFSTVSFEIVIGIIIAMLVSSDNLRSRLTMTLFMIPMIMAPVASGTLWRMMFDRSSGIVNYLLSFAGIDPVNWLGTSKLAMLSIIFVDIWRLTPWVTILIVSALKGVSISLLEAAIVDGATPWKTFTKIILPLLKPVIIIVLMIRFVDAFKVFDIVYVMTNGGPGTSTEMLPNYIFNQGLTYFDASYAAALAVVFILVMSLATFGFVKVRKTQQIKLR